MGRTPKGILILECPDGQKSYKISSKSNRIGACRTASGGRVALRARNYSKLNSKLFKILYGGCAGGAHFSWGGALTGGNYSKIKFKIIQIFRRDVGMVGGVENYGKYGDFCSKIITRFRGGGAHRRGLERNRGGGRWRCAGAT